MQQATLKSLRREFINPYTRMIPVKGWQADVYRMAEDLPPGLNGYQPRWEVVTGVVLARQTLLVQVPLRDDFHLLAILASATTNTASVGGFRAQIYDVLKRRKLQDRGMLLSSLGGGAAAPFFLREPYRFDLPLSMAKIVLTNMEAVTNTLQLVLYGVAAPFDGSMSNER